MVRIITASKGILKERSNLVADPALVLDTKSEKSNFLGFYNGAFKTPNAITLCRLWLAHTMPDILEANLLKPGRNLNALVRTFAAATSSGLITLDKKNDHFLAAMPLVRLPLDVKDRLAVDMADALGTNSETRRKVEESYAAFVLRNSGDRPQDIVIGEDNPITVKELNLQQAIAIASAGDANLRAVLSACAVKMNGVIVGDQYTVYLVLRIKKEEAQHLCTKPWVTVRAVDLYPMLQSWHSSGYGSTSRPPRSGFSVSTIAQTLPTDLRKVTPKVNKDFITCNKDGDPLYIPAVCDNTSRYEDLFMQAGQSPDGGAFTLMHRGASQKLPINIPVLVDWVNNKFSYTNTHGVLQVQNLSNCRQATSVHLHTWLSELVDLKQLESLFRMGDAVGVGDAQFEIKRSDFTMTDSEGEALSDAQAEQLYTTSSGLPPAQYAKKVIAFYQTTNMESPSYAALAFNSSVSYLRPIGRFIKKIADAAVANPDNLFSKYSILHTSTNLPWAILISKYAPQFGQLASEANTVTAAARNQGVDPDFKLEPVSMWNGDLGLLPHQDRIANVLRDSPPFAILPVPAGGGKTPLIIIDVLREIQANRSAPYLILCPGHLVAQYVKEINYFTKGQLNVIPINTTVMKRNGPERVSRLIETAPRNSVIVANYDALTLKGRTICYGTTSINVFPIADILRQFDFGYAALDEAHYVKNDSARSRAVMNLVVDIPKKRLASGTMAHDSPSDLAIQISQLDPTLFGTRDEFNEKYGQEVKGGRVISWKPGAAQEIMAAIKSRVVVAGANRKEWAALLPPIKERMSRVVLTEAQQIVYDLILAKTLEEIEANKALMDKMKEEDENYSKETDVDESAGEDLAMLLKPYIARLEQYISAPDRDPLGAQELRGDDRISPKVGRINEIVGTHLREGRPGKVLIFTNYTASAEAIYEYLDPSIKKVALLYTAAQKEEMGAAFETDDRYQVMIGVENSMNTGLNLQHVSCLIRLECVWNPGTLEQGNSRLNRPSMKKAEDRSMIYFEWIVADNTIDITKISRLTSKIVAVAKFENPNTDEYQELPDLPVVKMNLNNIRNLNSWSTGLQDYAQAYADYRNIVAEEYAEYKEKFIAKYGDNFITYPGEAPPPKDAKIMPDAPYVAGLEIPLQAKLKLIRLDEYLRQDSADEESDSEGDDDSNTGAEYRKRINDELRGALVHTAFGDGVIKSLATGVRVVTVTLNNGEVIRDSFASVFLMEKPLKKPVKQLIAESLKMPLSEEVDVPSATSLLLTPKRSATKKAELQKKKEQELQEALRATVTFAVTNGYIGLRVQEEGHSKEVLDALVALGFRPEPPYRRAWLKTHRLLDRQMKLWVEKGFAVHAETPEALNAFGEIFTLLQTGKVKQRLAVWKFANRNAIRNFFRIEYKPSTDAKTLKFYPIVEDGKAYIALPDRGQVATRKAIMQRASGIVWEQPEPALSWFAQSPSMAAAMLKKIVTNGVQLTNAAQLKKDFKLFKRHKPLENPGSVFDMEVDED